MSTVRGPLEGGRGAEVGQRAQTVGERGRSGRRRPVAFAEPAAVARGELLQLPGEEGGQPLEPPPPARVGRLGKAGLNPGGELTANRCELRPCDEGRQRHGAPPQVIRRCSPRRHEDEAALA